jgi:hypothetical protein
MAWVKLDSNGWLNFWFWPFIYLLFIAIIVFSFKSFLFLSSVSPCLRGEGF